MEYVLPAIGASISTVALLGFVSFLFKNLILERLKAAVRAEYAEKLEKLKADLRREHGEALALNSLFAGSHLAAKVYDKQIEFCEGYWELLLKTIKEMERNAESPGLIDKANALYTYRMEWALWLSEEMALGLEDLENALRSVGVECHRLGTVPIGPQRSERVDRMMRLFEEIMNIPSTEAHSEKAPSYVEILKELQGLLGIAPACKWRRDFLERAERGLRRSD